jgi:hypothetical protein
MATNFSKGRYKVFQGSVPGVPPIGRIDEDEYVRTSNGTLIYRVDNDQFFDMDGQLLGFIEEVGKDAALVMNTAGYCLFVIAPE